MIGFAARPGTLVLPIWMISIAISLICGHKKSRIFANSFGYSGL